MSGTENTAPDDPKIITVLDILDQYLRANGYDGLVNPDAECGCRLGDLRPCASDFSGCEPAYRREHEDGWRMCRRKADAEASKEDNQDDWVLECFY